MHYQQPWLPQATEVKTVKVGKHGHTKTTITGVVMFGTKKLQLGMPSSHRVWSFHAKQHDYGFLCIEGPSIRLMNEDGEESELPLDLQDKAIVASLTEAENEGAMVNCSVCTYMDKGRITDVKRL